MPKSATKTEIKLIVNIKPVKLTEVTPKQGQLYKRFWQKLRTEVEAKA